VALCAQICFAVCWSTELEASSYGSLRARVPSSTMNTPLSGMAAPVAVIFLAVALILKRYLFKKPIPSKVWFGNLSTSATEDVTLDLPSSPRKQTTVPPVVNNRVSQDREAESEDLVSIKKLYHQLHCLEQYPTVIPSAKRLLLSLLKETSSQAQTLPVYENILSIKQFSRKSLDIFQHRRNDHIGKEWEAYNARRKAGGRRELFQDRGEAIWWLKQISPVKYVDGAWLGHIDKVTTPFALRRTIKGAWQILSEELGDGDLRKNHVNLYHRLPQSVAPGFPTADMADFGSQRHELNSLSVWKSAVAQLLVSLMPHEFLPETLGFNLHFEGISMDTLKAVRELREVGIDPYYFILHVSIDNSHSGHSAIAIEIVSEYMGYMLRNHGESAAQNAWEKIQAGYLLSLGLPGTVTCPSSQQVRLLRQPSFSLVEEDVISIFKAKSKVVQGLHCCSKVLIGEYRVAEWLDPIALESPRWQRNLLDALGDNRYWIRRGNSSESRFIRELEWNGRMFGSFTHAEYKIMKYWIDEMSDISRILRDDQAGQKLDSSKLEDEEILSGHPVFRPVVEIWNHYKYPSLSSFTSFPFQDIPALQITSNPIPTNLIPLWLAHPCLLQGFVAVPFRTASHFACTVVKILRAQGGFEAEQECIAGLSELQRPDSLGLVGIGMNMLSAQGCSLVAVPSLVEVLQKWPNQFAIDLLHLSHRPVEFRGLLIGVASAFAKLHEAMVKLEPSYLAPGDRNILRDIVDREMDGLKICWEELQADERLYVECCKGYLLAAEEIQKCFE